MKKRGGHGDLSIEANERQEAKEYPQYKLKMATIGKY